MPLTGTFGTDINASADPFQWTLKYKSESKDSSLELSDLMVQERGREGGFGASAPY
jgi:hypothetical protein